MSNRTLVELNHDYCPREDELLAWAKAMRDYMTSGNIESLPAGVTLKYFRHHSDPEPHTEMLELARRVVAYFPKGNIDQLLDADIKLRQMARNILRKAAGER